MFIKEEVENEIVIEKSRFITYLKKVDTVNEYKDYLKTIKKLHYNATHVCSACVLKDYKKASDDGEPSGTAGMPILNVLEKNEMENICALVVRYFGGIKLGAGGLIRAYSNSTKLALDKACKYIELVYPSYELQLDYDKANRVEHFIMTNTIDPKVTYDQKVIFHFAIEDEAILDKLLEYTKGIQPIKAQDTIVKKVVE